MFDRHRVMRFLDDVVLMKDVTQKVAVIELVDARLIDLVGQTLEPVFVVSSQGNVQCDNVRYRIRVNCAIAYGCACNGETVQHGFIGLLCGAFKIRSVPSSHTVEITFK